MMPWRSWPVFRNVRVRYPGVSGRLAAVPLGQSVTNRRSCSRFLGPVLAFTSAPTPIRSRASTIFSHSPPTQRRHADRFPFSCAPLSIERRSPQAADFRRRAVAGTLRRSVNLYLLPQRIAGGQKLTCIGISGCFDPAWLYHRGPEQQCGRHGQLVASGQLNLGDRQLIEIYCQLTLQISDQISNFWILDALCSAAVI
jgi:hypothetical protein